MFGENLTDAVSWERIAAATPAPTPRPLAAPTTSAMRTTPIQPLPRIGAMGHVG